MQDSTNKPWLQWYDEKMKNLCLSEVSVYSLLKNTAERFPDHNAIIFEDKLTDYQTLKKQVDNLAGAWKEMGFKKGEKIGLMMANHPYFIIGYYAAHALGLTVVQVNPLYTLRELLQILKDTQLQYLVFSQEASKTVGEAQAEYQFKVRMSLEKRTEGTKSIHEMIEMNKGLDYTVQINPKEDLALIQYTGGTTGEIKGAMLTHYNLTSNVMQGIAMYGDSMVPGEEIILLTGPLYHVQAMTASMNTGIYLGATILLFSKFELQNVLENIKKYRPTFFGGVPKIYNDFVKYPEIEKYGLDSLKICTSASAPLPVEIISRFRELTGIGILEGFGISEASPSTHRNPHNKGKIGSIGIPFPGTECKIIDDQYNELAVNEVGELLVKGPQVMKGYFNNEAETKLTLRTGWLHTGDLAMMDDEGYFYIVGRKKEMIIVSGFNIYPKEIEEILYEYPDIKEAAVVGIPSSEFGEEIKAFLVPKDGANINTDDVKEYCYSKLTRYKVPKRFEIIQKLPRNTVGKILKRNLIKKENKEIEQEETSII
ncbi:long-chain-fatty-acid--CoA ligase [Peribacillus muralis]|uniref:long-chain-fatty-acid--CoA ligase n=1 Tax=Peribacillus muralis TaxID=264697 RepID=UPI00070B03B8|nr:long-chain fatty acid--CoA ligase [Peribacillus muralis]